MHVKCTIGMLLGAIAMSVAPLETCYAGSQKASRSPAYTSSIRIQDHDRQGHGERQTKRSEAAQLASLARIDVTQATAAALAQVPGTVLKAALDNEDGNIVYSVEIMTSTRKIKDVKVDAGTGAVLHIEEEGED